MNADRQLEQQLPTWFAGQTTSAAPELLPRAVARIRRIEQRPAFLTRDWYGVRGAAVPGGRVLVPAVVVLLVLVAAALVVTSGGLGPPRPPVTADTKAFFAPPTDVAFRANLRAAGSIPRFNWRAGTYSAYSGTGWNWGDVVGIPVAAGERIDAFSASDEPETPGRLRVDIAVTPVSFDGPQVVGPDAIESVDVPVEAVAVGAERWFTSIDRRGSGPYALSALLPVPSAAPGRLNEATLRGAGQAYSASMLGVYTQLPEDAVGPASIALLEEIRAAVPSGQDPRNPYDLARAMERFLLEPANFAYDADVRAEVTESCDGLSTVECFATIRRGYCEFYATTMAVLLRESGIPARIGYGFLGGERDRDGVETVGGSLAHWWVEVYFPGSGWYPFDPTGSVGRPFTLPPGT